MSMFTSSFWKGTAERAISTAAQSAILVLGADQINAINADWVTVGGFAAGGFALTVLKCLASNSVAGPGPSITGSEVPADQVAVTTEQYHGNILGKA